MAVCLLAVVPDAAEAQDSNRAAVVPPVATDSVIRSDESGITIVRASLPSPLTYQMDLNTPEVLPLSVPDATPGRVIGGALLGGAVGFLATVAMIGVSAEGTELFLAVIPGSVIGGYLGVLIFAGS